MAGSTPENDVTVPKNVYGEGDTAAAVDPPVDRRRKKKSGAFGIFKAALYMMRRRRAENKSTAKIVLAEPAAAAETDQNPNWTKLVGSVRPFHLQEMAESPPASPMASVGDEMAPPASPAASSSRGTMSQYSSSASLLDLDNSSDEEEGDPDEVFDALTGDEMIDAKAEEFIAQFYKEMQLQKTTRYHNNNHHHHHHHLSRGI